MQSWFEQHSSGYQECPCARKAGAAATNTADSKMRKAFIGGPFLHVRGHEEAHHVPTSEFILSNADVHAAVFRLPHGEALGNDRRAVFGGDNYLRQPTAYR